MLFPLKTPTARLSEEVIVLIANNERKLKAQTFDLEERTEMARTAVAARGIPSGRSIVFDCLDPESSSG